MSLTRSHTSRREVRALLRAASHGPMVTARPAFVRGLEARLGGQVPPARVVTLPRQERRRYVPRVTTGAVAATVALVLVGALTGLYGQGGEDRALALTVAVDTTVQLPDGTTFQGTPGASLPEGAIVRTGARGRASTGNVDFGAGIEAIVERGHLNLGPFLDLGEIAQALPGAPAVPPIPVPGPGGGAP